MPEKKEQKSKTKSRSTEKTKSITIKVSEREFKSLESLAQLVNTDISKVVRACVRQSADKVRKNYLRDFVKKVKELPDPFGEDDEEREIEARAMARTVDDSDRTLADKYDRLFAKPTKKELEEERGWWKEEPLIN